MLQISKGTGYFSRILARFIENVKFNPRLNYLLFSYFTPYFTPCNRLVG